MRVQVATAGRWLALVAALVATFYIVTLLEAALGRCP